MYVVSFVFLLTRGCATSFAAFFQASIEIGCLGHLLVAQLAESGGPADENWRCACGFHFFYLSIHAHKAGHA
jgi:hypothetical protein